MIEQSYAPETITLQRADQPAVESVAGRFDEQSFTFPGGTLPYRTFVPPGDDGQRSLPLLVMLHGCVQDPEDFATGTRMNEVAEREGFLVLYPGQSWTRNVLRCWSWFEDDETERESGEAGLIADLTREVIEEYAVDERRIYVAGLSAGGAMAANLVVAYPDLYAGAAIHSGLQYDAAEGLTEVGEVMQNGGPDPQVTGTQAYRDMGEHATVVPTIVFHGTGDTTVAPINGVQAAEQATQMNDLAENDGADADTIDYTPDRVLDGQASGVPAGRKYTRYEYHDRSGQPVVVTYLIDGMGHAWSGGAPGGSFTDSSGPDASYLVWDFFEANAEQTRAPVADANSVVAAVGEPVTLYGRGSVDPDGTIVRFEWQFGDGTEAAGETVTHVYDDPGEYTATLTVTDDDGQTATDHTTVVIEEL